MQGVRGRRERVDVLERTAESAALVLLQPSPEVVLRASPERVTLVEASGSATSAKAPGSLSMYMES